MTGRHHTSLSSADKVAALLLCMERNTSHRLLSSLDESEVKRIADRTSKLGVLARDCVETVFNEFSLAIVAEPTLAGDTTTTEQLLLGVIPDEKIEDIVSELNGRPPRRIWSDLSNQPASAIADYLSQHDASIAAIVLAQISSEKSAETLALLNREDQIGISEAMLRANPIHDTAIECLALDVQEVFFKSSATPTKPVATAHATLAGVVNNMAAADAETLLAALSQRHPDDTKQLQKLLFRFEDMTRLAPEALAKVFEIVPVETTLAALFGTDGDFQTPILAVQTQRSRRMIEAELKTGRSPSKDDIARAQRAIAETVLQLLRAGAISIEP
jgi:flagellar motor switch protein FliG